MKNPLYWKVQVVPVQIQHKGLTIMDKDTLLSSFGKWVSRINFQKFHDHIQAIQQDKYTKKLTTPAYLTLFLYAHLFEKESLRAISDSILDEELQQAVGFESISAAQLSRKHNQVEPSLLALVFLDLVRQIRCHKLGRQKQPLPLKIIDSTTIPLNLTKYRWATFRKTKSGVKLHLRLVFMDQEHVYPDQAVITPASEHDSTQLEVLVDEKDAMHVFDRAYVDYETFDRFFDEGIFFASRLKKNAVCRVIETFSVRKESPIQSDAMVILGNPQNRTENVFRLIETEDSQGNPIRIITNRFDGSAEEIGDIYRSRWAIELFFKWLKQHVRIKQFYGMSETAVQNQIYIALIMFCLLVLVQLETLATSSVVETIRKVVSPD
jgi:IS4 transposase